MNEESSFMSVLILGKEYRVVCAAKEKPELLAAAHYLDEKMRETKRSGKIIGGERVAVITALNISHELLQHQHGLAANKNLSDRISKLRFRIDEELDRQGEVDV